MRNMTVKVPVEAARRAARMAPSLPPGVVIRRLLEVGLEAVEADPGRLLGGGAGGPGYSTREA